MHLYMFYLGGNAGKSNIEVHDIQFVAAEKPEDAWPALRDAWFGDPDKVHIDGYARVVWVDGYTVTLSDTRPADDNRLFLSTPALTIHQRWLSCMRSIYLWRRVHKKQNRKDWHRS